MPKPREWRVALRSWHARLNDIANSIFPGWTKRPDRVEHGANMAGQDKQAPDNPAKPEGAKAAGQDNQKSDSTEKSKPADPKSLDQRALRVLVIVVLLGLLGTFVFGTQATSYRSFAAVAAFSLAVAGASILVGGLVGFLFGIPRRLQMEAELAKAKPEPGAEEEVKSERALYGANTNLEQISDWLTKILVGVGLTQIGQIGPVLGDLGTAAAQGLEGFSGARPFFIAIIVHFTVSGFLLGYLWTRLYLGRALTEAERTSSLEKKVDLFEKDAEAMRLTVRQLSGDVGGRPIPQDQLNAAIKAASPETRAFTFSRARDQRYRNWRDNRRVMKRTIPIFQALIASDTEHDYHQNFGELGFALKDQQEPDWKAAEDCLTEAIRIRGDARQRGFHSYEFNRAFCRIMQDPEFLKDPPAPGTDKVKSDILADLKIAVEDAWVRDWPDSNPTIKSWMKVNKVSRASLDR